MPAILARLVQVTQSNRHGPCMLQRSFIHYHFLAWCMQLAYRENQWAWEHFLSRECSKLSIIICIANSEHQGKPRTTWSLISLHKQGWRWGRVPVCVLFWCPCPPSRKHQLAVCIKVLEGSLKRKPPCNSQECCLWTSHHPHIADSK